MVGLMLTVKLGSEGETDTTPYWRTLKAGGELNPKYPGGVESLRERLESEGHTVVTRGKRLFVVHLEQALCDFLESSPAEDRKRS